MSAMTTDCDLDTKALSDIKYQRLSSSLATDEGMLLLTITGAIRGGPEPDESTNRFTWATVEITTDVVRNNGRSLTRVTNIAEKLINGFLRIDHRLTFEDRVQYYKRICPELHPELGWVRTPIESDGRHPLIRRLVQIALNGYQWEEVHCRLIVIGDLLSEEDHEKHENHIRGLSMRQAISCTIEHFLEKVDDRGLPE